MPIAPPPGVRVFNGKPSYERQGMPLVLQQKKPDRLGGSTMSGFVTDSITVSSVYTISHFFRKFYEIYGKLLPFSEKYDRMLYQH
jgi:hypothetical protein